MPDTRFTLIGKVCVWAVRATDTELRKVLKRGGWKGLSIRKKKRTKKQLANDKKLGRMAKMRRR